MIAVLVEHLEKRFGSFTAVEDVSFAVPRAQVIALLGPNGAGKTTTVEILEGFLSPTAGTVRVLGVDPRRGGRAWRARIGLVLQSTSLDAELTVRDAISLFASLYPCPRPVDEVLDVLELADHARTRIGALSGGQRRRVDVALGIVGRPEVLFLDEPTTGLDPEARRHAWSGVRNLTATGTTVVMTTHYVEEADLLADRVVVLADGRVLADTTPRELKARGGPTTIRCPLPAGARLPAELASHITGNELVLRSHDVTSDLGALVRWADRGGLDLSGLHVGPPSLEDAYLNIVDRVPAHV